MPQRAEVGLDREQRETLERWALRPKSTQALAFRCRIVLAAAEGRSSTEIAAELGTTGTTVGKWRGRFARRGIDGLHDEPRPGKPRSIRDEQSSGSSRRRRAAPGERDALLDPLAGGRDRNEPERGQPDLARLRAQAASG